jgi:hypothetical protein
MYNQVSKVLKASDSGTEFLQVTAIRFAVEKRKSTRN